MATNTHQRTSSPHDYLRQFNKHILNPMMLRLVRFIPFYGVIEHVGRRSGKAYRTPVVVGRAVDGFYIPLPYGDHVDWHRNIQAADHFAIVWRGRKYPVRYGAIVDDAEAMPQIHRLVRPGLKRARVKSYLKVADISS